MNGKDKERFFSIELESKTNLSKVTLSDRGHENVLVEGTLGVLQRAAFADGVVLEIVGDKGVLRVNVAKNEIEQRETRENEVLK